LNSGDAKSEAGAERFAARDVLVSQGPREEAFVAHPIGRTPRTQVRRLESAKIARKLNTPARCSGHTER
jgi:hypothetical protein